MCLHFDPLSKAFSYRCVFDENVQRIRSAFSVFVSSALSMCYCRVRQKCVYRNQSFILTRYVKELENSFKIRVKRV